MISAPSGEEDWPDLHHNDEEAEGHQRHLQAGQHGRI
jgi:hypothetical protein